jgi:hypothetical protein
LLVLSQAGLLEVPDLYSAGVQSSSAIVLAVRLDLVSVLRVALPITRLARLLGVPCIPPAVRPLVDLLGRVRRWAGAGLDFQRGRASVVRGRARAELPVWFRLRARLRGRKGRADRPAVAAAIVATRRPKRAR